MIMEINESKAITNLFHIIENVHLMVESVI